MISKAEAIRRLAKDGYSFSAISNAVGCSQTYVRVVVRQRTGTGGMSKSDRKYAEENAEKIRDRMRAYMKDYQRERYAVDPAFREARLKAGKESRARRKQREAQGAKRASLGVAE